MIGTRSHLDAADAGVAPSPGATDAELIERSCAGSRSSFGVLVERHQPHVYSLLRRRIRSAADAEDLAQDTFVRAWENLGRFDRSRCFRTWVHTIAARLAIDHLRSRTAAVRREGAVGRARELPRGPEAAEDGMPAVWERAREVLDETPFTALWLRYVEGLETNQIARVLGKNRVAVSMILCRARARLASCLESPAGDGARAETTVKTKSVGGSAAASRPNAAAATGAHS